MVTYCGIGCYMLILTNSDVCHNNIEYGSICSTICMCVECMCIMTLKQDVQVLFFLDDLFYTFNENRFMAK